MYYIYLGKRGDFSSPEKLIIQYENNWFYRKKTTDWELMEEEEILSFKSGNDENYYAIEKDQFNSILSSWGGSRFGYKNLDLTGEEDDSGYGDEYDD